jgi:hypothetical protein
LLKDLQRRGALMAYKKQSYNGLIRFGRSHSSLQASPASCASQQGHEIDLILLYLLRIGLLRRRLLLMRLRLLLLLWSRVSRLLRTRALRYELSQCILWRKVVLGEMRVLVAVAEMLLLLLLQMRW